MSQWHAGTKFALFGCRPRSLGWHIDELLDPEDVTTFGPGRNTLPIPVYGQDEDGNPFTEAIHDVNWEWPRNKVPDLRPFDNVVVTIGLNLPDEDDPNGVLQMEVNYFGVMALAEEWARLSKPGHFVVVSSNSAHIARSTSRGYCASKAALSMGIRCLARREAKTGPGIFYGWEFGLLTGTPMTSEVLGQLPQGVAPSRIPGAENGLPTDQAARHVVSALRYGWRELNGCMLRVDGGEQ